MQNEWREIHPGSNVWTCAAETLDTVLISCKNASPHYIAKVHVSLAGSTNVSVKAAMSGMCDGESVTVVLPPLDTAPVALITPQDKSKPYIVMHTTSCDLYPPDALEALLSQIHISTTTTTNAVMSVSPENNTSDIPMGTLDMFCDAVVENGEKQSEQYAQWLRSRNHNSPYPTAFNSNNNTKVSTYSPTRASPSQLNLCGRVVGSHQMFEIAPNSNVYLKITQPGVDEAIVFEVENDASHGICITFDLRGSGPNIAHAALSPADADQALLFTVKPGTKQQLLLIYPRYPNNSWTPTVDFRWRWVYEAPPKVVTELLRQTPPLYLVRESDTETGSTVITLDNKSVHWVHSTVNFSGSVNAVMEPGSLVTTSVPPQSKKKVATLSPQDPTMPWEIQYQASWTDGISVQPRAHHSLQSITDVVGEDGIHLTRQAIINVDHATIEITMLHRGHSAVHVILDLTATSGCEITPSETCVQHPAFFHGLRVLQFRLIPGVAIHIATLKCNSQALLTFKYDCRWCEVGSMKGFKVLPWPDPSLLLKI